MKKGLIWLIAVAVIQITFVLAAQAAVQTVSLTMWELPYDKAFPAGLALGAGGEVYVAAEGGMEVYRLDPENDLYRSWGVGEGPTDVIAIDGVVFASVGYDELVVYFNPDGLATNSARIPSPHVGLGEIHRGADAASGDVVLWLAEMSSPGILRFEYDPVTDAPAAIGSPSEVGAARKGMTLVPETVATGYEKYSYDIAQLPAPTPAPAARTSLPFTEWELPFGDFTVTDIAVADDGTLWISYGAAFLVRFDPIAETVQMMETIQNVAIFQGLLPAPDGSIWFGNIIEGAIGHFDPAIGLSEVWRIPGTGEVYDLLFADDGRIWYTDRTRDAIGLFDPRSGEVTIYPLPAGSEPLYLAIGEDGAVWFTAGAGNYIGRLAISD